MDIIIRIVFLVGLLLIAVGILEIASSVAIFIYRLHRSIFTDTVFHESPSPLHVRLMEKLFYSGAFLVVVGMVIDIFTSHGINKW